MNFYNMDLEEYQRFVRNNAIKDDLTLAILEDLTEISRIYNNFIEVLEEFDLCTYNPEFLRIELKEREFNTKFLEDENKTLQKELNKI